MTADHPSLSHHPPPLRHRAAMRGLICLLLLVGMTACHGRPDQPQIRQAKLLIADHCAACHQVPGVVGASGRVGPSLAGIARQQIIAGHFANTPAMLSQWIEHPQQLLPGDAMPEMGLTQQEARAITTYLYTLD